MSKRYMQVFFYSANLYGAAGLAGKITVSLTCSNCMQIDPLSLKTDYDRTNYFPKVYMNI